jgi:hypothetical protein
MFLADPSTGKASIAENRDVVGPPRVEEDPCGLWWIPKAAAPMSLLDERCLSTTPQVRESERSGRLNSIKCLVW